MKHRLKDLSRQLTVANQGFKICEFTFKATQVRAAM
jgi:hypothetical protein